MKKTIITAVLISGLAITTIASANWGHGGNGFNAGICPQTPCNQQIDPAIQGKLDTFYAETVGLRKEIAVKQAEQRAMMSGTNPDPAAVAKLTGELFDLRTSMQDKAVAAGVDQYVGPMMGAGGRGMGPGMGGGRGMMRGGCPNF